ncbi:MAG TPA: hypothetical protein VFF73_13610 [Planctomycetota bacterium]|nr:hypothetical protein [Planctomycetota bacterium]
MRAIAPKLVRALAVSLALAGCGSGPELEPEAKTVEALVAALHSADFTERETATRMLFAREAVSIRALVIPHLALESVVIPLEIDAKDGNLVRGRIAGGDEQTIQVQITKRVAKDAVLSLRLSDIKALRLFP